MYVKIRMKENCSSIFVWGPQKFLIFGERRERGAVCAVTIVTRLAERVSTLRGGVEWGVKKNLDTHSTKRVENPKMYVNFSKKEN